MKNHFTKTAAVAIALLAHGCLMIPIPIPVPIPVGDTSTPNTSSSPKATPVEETINEKYKNTCYADALTESEAQEITEKSKNLEAVADKLVAEGKNKEAIRKYNEASAALLNEAIADGTTFDMEFSAILHGENIEEFREDNRPLIQKAAESNFKIGTSYSRLGQYENAIDCFNSVLTIGILPPNDAIAYLNRGDAYERMGDKVKAKADFQQAAILFKKHKQPAYQKMAEQRLQAVK